tara:strand:- start:746 stop:988 length:243 start_codon:yes stop_codon:yes gene_type:complete
MVTYTLNNLDLREIKALRKSLDYLPITGIDAMFVALLQTKLNDKINKVEEQLAKEQNTKQEGLKEIIQHEKGKNKGRKTT